MRSAMMAWACLVLASALEGAAAPGESGPAVLKDDAGHEIITYVARTPPKPRTDVRPALLIGFHGSGGNAEQLVGAAGAALEHAALRDEYVVIGLKSRAVGWEETDDAPVRAFIAWAIKQYHADPRRVYGLGYSSGAFFLNRFAPSNPELFAGAITYVGGQYGLRKDDHPETAAALYWVVGQRDGTVKADGVLPQMEAFRKAGYSGVYRNMRDLGHECCKEPTMEDAVRWMQALRNRRLPLAADEQSFLERFADPDKAKRLFNEPGAWQRLIQIGGPQAAAVVVQALTGDKEPVRGNAALACRHVMFDQRVVCALAALLDDKSPKLRESALAGLAAQAAWNEGCAQQALCAFAADPKRKPSERRAAAASLGAVARIDLMGSFQARRVIWTLVGLLDDEDAAVRQVAFAALQVADGVGFDYKPEASRPQRKASCERWAEWCTKTCGERPADVQAPVP